MDLLHKPPCAEPSTSATASPAIEIPLKPTGIRSRIFLVLRIVLTVTLCEILVITVLQLFPVISPRIMVVLDAALMILLLSSVLYLAVIRPMVRYMLAQQRSEELLKRHGDHLESLVSQRTEELSAANETLRQQIRVRTRAENLMQERTFELDDYIRELQCLYAVSRLMEKPDISIENLITKLIGLIPFAWLNPEIIGVRVTVEDREFKTENFEKSQWQQTGRIMVNGECVGLLEVVNLQESAGSDTGLNPQREKSLIEAVSDRLGGVLERIQTANRLNRELVVNEALSHLYKPLISPSASLEDTALAVLNEAANLTKSRDGYLAAIGPGNGDAAALDLIVLPRVRCDIASGKRSDGTGPSGSSYPGLWGYSLNSLDAFYTNTPQKHPDSAGTPAGHVPIRRFLSVPIMIGDNLAGQIALANKEEDYSERDLDAVRRVVEFYALALQRKKAEKALQESKNDLEFRVEARTAEIEQANKMLTAEIDERKLVEIQLRQNRAMLQAVFDGIADPLILIDRHMTVKMINRASVAYYRIGNNQDIIGTSWREAAAETGRFVDSQIPSAVSGNRVFSFERRGFMESERLERVWIYPVMEKTRDVGDAVIHIRDITEQRRIENQLIQSEKLASLGVLVSSIAHEINNPNSFVTFNLPILKEYIDALLPYVDKFAAGHPDLELFNMPYSEFRADMIKLIQNVDRGAKRISTFVSNLREFSQHQGKKPKKWVDLNTVIQKVLSICGGNIKKTVTSFELSIPDNFPAVYSDPHVLEQVLFNILMNAAQAVDKEKSWVMLNATFGKSMREHIIIEISDNGCGMDAETKRHIFDPFFTTKPPTEGTGLGLYVTHNLIQSIGGYIEVDSEPGRGSTFRLILSDKDYLGEDKVMG